ncbi:NUDIX family hydrolase, putative [Talaromyces stipitatus ATCC 10500]|uniref:NUDIX family hydrolase, putative n=1 Tax=Talaromyces stipitatus (strain ATCC 10500 / CBS 375.48 / QM 6759 / NRRL 1006) TaxID=441959 RepID=B8MKP7_TALSN|nr:NUDIX family hydrolase, putative [Talaromyces stipitatus ATCC 10500]EED14896.1 NUDIX family hydrolase, putative [Talaromyces stipitatus ATCC 10500]
MASTTESPRLIESFHNALLNTHQNPCAEVQNPPNCEKRASVAVILRVRPQYKHLPQSPVTVTDKTASTPQQLSKFFAQDWVQHGDPELLFIKRASRVGDRWTGHVALPGGKRDLEDEDDKATAVREAQEEIGLDLNKEDLIFIGNLPERVVTTSFGSVPLMVLCPFIFLLTSNISPNLTLQPTEVASTHWVSLRALLSPSLRSVEHVNVSARYAKQNRLIRWGSSRWMTGMMEFSALRLLPTESLYCSSTPGFLPDESHQTRPFILQRFNPWAARPAAYGDKNRELLLWGLTLGIMADFLDLLPPHNAIDLWKHPTFTAPDLRLIVSLLTYSIRKRNAAKVKAARRPSQTAADDSTIALSYEEDGQSDNANNEKDSSVSGHEHATAILLQGYYDRLRLSLGVFAVWRLALGSVGAYYIWKQLRPR